DDRVTVDLGRENVGYVNGSPDTELHPGVVQTLAGGTLSQVSDATYRLDWIGGEFITVTNQGVWFDWTVALGPHDGPGSVRGLLGSNAGQANDFQLHDGTVLPQPLSEDEILSKFAGAWSVAGSASLLDETQNHALHVQTMAAMPSATDAGHVAAVGLAPLHD